MNHPAPTPDSGTSEENNTLDESHDSRLRVYKDGVLVKDQTTCGSCGLVHIPPMTHEIHQIFVEEHAKAADCDDCVYGQYSPHLGVGEKLQSLLQAERKRGAEKYRFCAECHQIATEKGGWYGYCETHGNLSGHQTLLLTISEMERLNQLNTQEDNHDQD